MPTLEEIARNARESGTTGTAEPLELAVFDAKNAVQIFTQGGLDAVLDGIEAKVRAEIVHDIVEMSAAEIAEAIMDGKVRNVKAVF